MPTFPPSLKGWVERFCPDDLTFQVVAVLLDQTCVHSPTHSKANILTVGCAVFIAGIKQGVQVANDQKT